ncbi:MAG: spermidine/putrescine ABC transporter permease [Litorilinea sp.]|nr:MAG: spermidine/putrescine ABC transporter permease [Litorilinea sp.]
MAVKPWQTIWQEYRSPLRRHEAWHGILFAGPWIIGFLAFVAGPFLASFILSFTSYKVGMDSRWIGLQNYHEMFFKDPLFWKSLYNTGYYVFFAVPLGVLGSLLLALLMNQKVRGIPIFRTMVYVPSIVSGVAVAYLWMWLLDPNIGLVNYVLRSLHLPAPLWVQSETWAKPALILVSLYGIGGGTMVIFLAGLQNIPESLYEAAELDGAGRWRKFLNITLPMLSPIILFNFVVGIIGSFQVFTQAYVMTRGGPANATMFFVLYLYNVAFWYGRMGYGSALAWILFLIILAFTIVQLKLSNRWVYYEE